MAHHLHFMKACNDDERVLNFLRDLFADFPDVLASEGGARLLFRLVHWAPVPQLSTWVEQLRRQDGRFSKQLAGEILAACDLAGRLPGVASTRLIEADDDEAVGILLRASEWWAEEDVRRAATGLLVAGAALGGRAGSCASRALERSDIIVDDFTFRLIRAVLDAGTSSALPSAFLEQLDQLAPEKPALALEIATRTLDAAQGARAQLVGSCGVGPAMTSVALTLQRMHGFRDEGLALFERLLAMDVLGVRDALSELDRRPGVAAHVPRGGRRRVTSARRRRVAAA